MRKIVLLIFLPIFLNACALCSLYTPKIHSKIGLDIKDKNLLGLDIEWTFSKEFTRQLLDSYDNNGNDKFDILEIQDLNETLVKYIEPKNFLTKITFFDDSKENNLKFKIKGYKLHYKNKQFIFNYHINCLFKLIENRTIKISQNDDEGFFDFRILQAKKIALPNSLYLIPNINAQFAFYKISKESIVPVVHEKNLLDIVPKTNSLEQEKEKSNYINALRNILKTYTSNIKTSLQSMATENSLKKMFILLGFSFLYGFFHALGPGHGKTLVSSYFLANGGNWYKALIFSFRIGIIHVLSAFVLVMTSMYIIKTFISKVLSDISIYTSYISATIIISIALFMLYKKFKHNAHHEHTHSCSCHACDSVKKDWGIAIAAGIVPCAGTVVIFILTFTLGNYMIGFLSALAMALGMGSVIFVSSVFAQYLHVNITNKYQNLLSIIEYLAIIFLLVLGIFLLVSPLKI